MAIRTKKETESLYRALMLPRVIEEKQLRLIRQGRLSKWFSGYGQEGIAVGVAWGLVDEDYLLPMHRNLGVWTTRGVALDRLFCQLMGRQGGYTKGRDRTFHFGLPDKHIVGMISHLAAMLPVADGLGLAARLRNENRVAAAFVGEGATREGDFHEALNLASVWKLPVLFVIENNGYGLSTPTAEAVPVENLADAGPGYGMVSTIVDGNDVVAVIEAVRAARKRAVQGHGPTLLEMKTFRMRGHEEASGTKYVPRELQDRWATLDPIARFQPLAEAKLGADTCARIREELVAQIDKLAEWALEQPEVTSSAETEYADVFAPLAPGIPSVAPASGARTEKRFIDAISDGLRTWMQEEPDSVIMGQDIAEYGGVFKVTEGFVEAFGRDRVRNTPIIESAAVGAAMGLALAGVKPVLEIQYADFISCGFNQIVNNLATTFYRWGAPINVTIRAPFGGGIGAGPFHSQSMEAWFCHVPGLKVVVPATPEDAKGLLLSSLDDPNPVLFFEHKKLYRSIKGPVPEDAVRIPLGKASVVREGRDVTIVTWGVGVHWAVEEAEKQALRGVDIEVIDLRTLIPWDRETVLASVRKSGRAILLHEAPRTGGFGAEIAAEISQLAFDALDAPPMRIGGADMPIAFSKAIEEGIYSAQSRLSAAVDEVLSY
ncbi:MAG: dehydrogenase E1 component subunit alpha/beta [Bacteroidetes bacterium]|nr:dehydrogenase E1 component subunit alpha/beta [Bacteroidota bacterium]